MASGPTVVVNFEALGALSQRLQFIHSSFVSLGAHPSVDSTALGDSGLAGEFEHFLDGWSQGRRQIEGELTAVVKAVSNAVTTYDRADQGIATDETGGSMASPAGGGNGGAVDG